MNKHYFALVTLFYYDINELKNKYLKIKLIISIFLLLYRWNWIENCLQIATAVCNLSLYFMENGVKFECEHQMVSFVILR